jgi:hypothetical protein
MVSGLPEAPPAPAAPSPAAPSVWDVRMCRLLRVPPGGQGATQDEAHRLFSVSMVLSGLRCLFGYVFVPILAPIIGPASGGKPEIGIPLSVVALIFDVRAVRRFWLADHPWRWRIAAVYVVVMLLVTGLLVHDILQVI